MLMETGMDEQHERFLTAVREVRDERGFANVRDIMDRLGMDINAPADRAAYREIMPELGRLGYVDCGRISVEGLPCGHVRVLT